jgi:formimidoylglutamate deiminase
MSRPHATFWAPSALLGDVWVDGVRIHVNEIGDVASIDSGGPHPGDQRLPGAVIPGMPNLHSHAFQRALLGRTQRKGPGDDSFWTWREAMYGSLDHLGPVEVEAITAWLCVELLEGGFTQLGEFHYVHHQPDGTPYADRAELARRVIAGARTAGMGLTMLPVLYAASGFGPLPPSHGQRRFIDSADGVLRLIDALRPECGPDLRLGLAPHSLRAVPPEALEEALVGLPSDAPVHIHIAEQTAEVRACQAWSGKRPIAWLLDHHDVDGRWCLVHATHLDADELDRVARSGAVVGLCPTTEADLGDGVFPATDLIAGGGHYGVGTDSHVGRSAPAELRLLEYGQRLRDQRRIRVLGPEDAHAGAALWRDAARGGAQALGVLAGSIAPGHRADFVSLDPEHAVLEGLSGDALLDGLVLGQGDTAVHTVVSGGRVVVEAGRHHRRDALRAPFRRAIQRLFP